MSNVDHYGEAERLFGDLHQLIVAGSSACEDADAVRDRLDECWALVTPDERHLLRGLSEDLYSLCDEEAPREATIREVTRIAHQLRSAYSGKDWRRTLSLLRRAHLLTGERSPLTRSEIAHIRARCWSELGRWRPAFWFAAFAASLDPKDARFTAFAVRARYEMGEKSQAVDESMRLVAGKDVPAPLAILVAGIPFDAARESILAAPRRNYYAFIAEHLPQHTSRIRDASPILFYGLLTLGTALEELRLVKKAQNVFDELVLRFPSNPNASAVRGLFLSRIDLARSEPDLTTAVRLGTDLPEPYLVLAQVSINGRRFDSAVEWCQRGLALSTRPALNALFHHMLAVAHAGRAAPKREVRAAFSAAISAAPRVTAIRWDRDEYERHQSEGLRSRKVVLAPPQPREVRRLSRIESTGPFLASTGDVESGLGAVIV
jgi:hypothetical protein